MRQLLVLRDSAAGFSQPQFRKFDLLKISHSGHLMDPETDFVIWRRPGKPQPTCEKILPGVRETNRTHGAQARPRREPQPTDEPRERLNATTWPPDNLRVPRELFKFMKDTPLNLCYVCQDQGHRGKDCAFLTAALMETRERLRCLEYAQVDVPKNVQDSVASHRKCLNFVLQFHWPLREACTLARKLL